MTITNITTSTKASWENQQYFYGIYGKRLEDIVNNRLKVYMHPMSCPKCHVVNHI